MTATDLLAQPASQDWHQCLARFIQSTSATTFPGMLEQALRERIAFDSILINTYKGRYRPPLLFRLFLDHVPLVSPRQQSQ